jgi:predicted anti-sigma-YlaC factor YlaD
MLSTFEAALLDRHLRRCAECRRFAASAAAQTQLLRAAELELPERPVAIPSRGTRQQIRRGAVGALSAVAAAAAAALVVFSSSTESNAGRGESALTASRTGRTVLVVYAARLSPSSRIDVPRLRVQPASIADGPVHGYFSTPVEV